MKKQNVFKFSHFTDYIFKTSLELTEECSKTNYTKISF